MGDGKYQHFFIDGIAESRKYTKKRQKIPSKSIPEVERNLHGQRIKSMLKKAWDEAKQINEQRTAVSLPSKEGMYLEFEGAPNFELATKSLEHHRKGEGIRLLNVKTEKLDDDNFVNRATVFIPKGKESYYLNKVQEYIDKDTDKHKPKNEPLIASLNNIKLAVLESFWQGNKEWIPEKEPAWCEIWLSSSDKEVEDYTRKLAKQLNISIQKESLDFPERKVILGKVNKSLLVELIAACPYIAEFRRASETAQFFIDMDNSEQIEWVKELKSRTTINDDSDVCVCILDTGVNNGHPLIKPVLKDQDCKSYDNSWGTHDHKGHGTGMAGLAIYGDLQLAIEGNHNVYLNHIIESCKILPPVGENKKKLYGAITEQAISNMIIDNPKRKRIICMAVTAPKYQMREGKPSSWSAAIDELTSGYLDEEQKLFFVSAGNIVDRRDWNNYPESNKTLTVQNPGQSWNAVTVGAYTDMINLDRDKKKYSETESVAPKGGLSPYSSTSYLWDKKGPIKPDIVMEGGNVRKDSLGCWECEELSLLTTYYKPSKRHFHFTNATSAATAQAACLAAKIQTQYPDAWPETIRALIIHSAEWTPAMKKHFLDRETKGCYKELLRICGHGVPNLNKALWCMENSVNLIVQSKLQPFDKSKDGSRYVTKDMHIHEIPWPKELLLELGDIPVSMKVTLSYFIEPSPGEIGWKERYRYASCGLRFDVNGTDTKESFLGRITAESEREDEGYKSNGGGVDWKIGKNNRHLGSIHSDIWEGTAAQLAVSNLIGIYPAIGWWRERAWLGRWNQKIRYSLIVSLETPKQDIDLYTPIYNIIKTKVPIVTGR
ncbi:S8 family peptidase [Herbivorax sp. ANBcel31]|uniref:S8 family peptidase n=1 Tax=Herbivorax sp. ANBcel31 TaxID=3069754 RepID=UPI0027B5C32C|nr:S8 family peptidase [Herbivorax sp. ANBcel31]MDQ2087917.1 S8 family peptidase [Herbivorax sp. ANBcel31]